MDTLIKVQFNPENFRRALRYIADEMPRFTTMPRGTAIISERTIESERYFSYFEIEFEGAIVPPTDNDYEKFYGYCNVR